MYPYVSRQQKATSFGEIKDVLLKPQNCEHVTKYHMTNARDFTGQSASSYHRLTP